MLSKSIRSHGYQYIQRRLFFYLELIELFPSIILSLARDMHTFVRTKAKMHLV